MNQCKILTINFLNYFNQFIRLMLALPTVHLFFKSNIVFLGRTKKRRNYAALVFIHCRLFVVVCSTMVSAPFFGNLTG